MFVSGFTFVRNAVKFDYPVTEAILSVLPLVDEFIVAVGNSDDGTLELIQSIHSAKIKIIQTVWDDTLREGGRVLAVETDKALQAVSPHATWAFYIQADEVVHEQYYPVIREAMTKYADDKNIDGLLFHYRHFYGSYDYVGESWRWYRREIRIVRNNAGVFSYKDAQGFRKRPTDKLRVKLIDAFIFHYGWVKNPSTMQEKRNGWLRLYRNNEWIEKNSGKAEEFDFSEVDSLANFTGTHPAVMIDRIQRKNWKFNYDISRNTYSLKEKVKRLLAAITGYRIGEYRNYKIR